MYGFVHTIVTVYAVCTAVHTDYWPLLSCLADDVDIEILFTGEANPALDQTQTQL